MFKEINGRQVWQSIVEQYTLDRERYAEAYKTFLADEFEGYHGSVHGPGGTFTYPALQAQDAKHGADLPVMEVGDTLNSFGYLLALAGAALSLKVNGHNTVFPVVTV